MSKYRGQPAIRAQLLSFYEQGTAQPDEMTPLYKKVDNAASRVFKVLVQMTEGPAYIMTRTTQSDHGLDIVCLL